MDTGNLLATSRDITVTACLLIGLVGVIRKWWVPYWVYKQTLEALEEMRAERDDFKRELFDSLGLADRATRVAEKTAERSARLPRERGTD